MITKRSGEFISHMDWFRNVIDENIILCNTSALECLGMFTGFLDEGRIEAYALEKGKYKNIEYYIVDSFSNIDYKEVNGARFTTFEQTINDMLKDLYNADEWALTEALSNYYFANKESFDGLNIHKGNEKAFESIRVEAINYYGEVF